jgi:hypothetical protein
MRRGPCENMTGSWFVYESASCPCSMSQRVYLRTSTSQNITVPQGHVALVVLVTTMGRQKTILLLTHVATICITEENLRWMKSG